MRDGRQHGGHSPFDVAGPPAVNPLPLTLRRKGSNRHPVGGDRVLMDFQQHDPIACRARDRPTRISRLSRPGKHRVTFPGELLFKGPLLQKIRHTTFQVLGALDVRDPSG